LSKRWFFDFFICGGFMKENKILIFSFCIIKVCTFSTKYWVRTLYFSYFFLDASTSSAQVQSMQKIKAQQFPTRLLISTEKTSKVKNKTAFQTASGTTLYFKRNLPAMALACAKGGIKAYKI